MKDVELVIKITEETLKDIKTLSDYGYDDMFYGLIGVIANGTPLPKGHGRLIDESKIKICGWDFISHHAKTDAPTIIEAESEVKE